MRSPVRRDVPGDVAGQVVFADGVLQRGLGDRVDVGHRQRGEPSVAALADCAARGEGLLAGGAVDADALAGVAGGQHVAGGLPAVALALVDGSVAVGAGAAG